MRTQVAPGIWRDDGPQSAHARYNQFAVQAVTVVSMVPVLHADYSTRRSQNVEITRRELGDKPGDPARPNLDDGDVKPAVIEVLP